MLFCDDVLGANVTIPHKEKVAALMDRLTEEAHATGAVNTITKEGRKLVGHNTDVPGFRVALDRLVGKQKMPRQAVVLGSGGGARAVVHGVVTEGFQRIVVLNPHLPPAQGLRDDAAAGGSPGPPLPEGKTRSAGRPSAATRPEGRAGTRSPASA